MSDDKVYEGDIKFGEATDSYDADGQVTATAPVPPLSVEQLNEAAASFLGDLQQIPPMVSAKKQGGVALYKLARKGIEVPREPRLVHIYNFRCTAYAEPVGKFRVACTKGTYVRSSRTIWGPSSAAVPTWPPSAASLPASGMWAMPSPSRPSSRFRWRSWKSA